jgi:hypothetical protein
LQAAIQAHAYRIDVLLPLLVLGLPPYLIGILFARQLWMFFGLFFILSAGGELLVLWLMRAVPADGASVNVIDTARSNRPTFGWSQLGPSLAESCRIEISSTMDFSQDVLSLELPDPNTYWMLDTDLSQNTRYFWRVAASDGNTTGAGSDVQSLLPSLNRGLC